MTFRLGKGISPATRKDAGVLLTSNPPLGLTTYLPPYWQNTSDNQGLDRLVSDSTVLSPCSTNPTAPPGEQSRNASYVISWYLMRQSHRRAMRETHLVGCEAIVELNNRDSIPPLTFRKPRLREDLVGTSSCHGETNELHCAPSFKCFDTIGHQCISNYFYCLVLQPMSMDKSLRCKDTTRCAVLEKVKLSKRRRYYD